jgi:hypothetical protein
MVVRSRAEGMIFAIDAIQTPSKAMNLELTPAQRNSREDDQNCHQVSKRVENRQLRKGGHAVRSRCLSIRKWPPDGWAGCTFAAGCENIKAPRIPTLAGIKYREPIVDEEQGIVLLRMNFGPDSVSGPDPVLVPLEIFKIYGGQIHAVEAFMKVFPASLGNGLGIALRSCNVADLTLASSPRLYSSALTVSITDLWPSSEPG